MSKDNKSLGRFTLTDIPPAPRGIPQIEVTFDIDANGILNVNAKDLGTGKEQKITITGSSGLSENEIEEMVKNAEAHADEDKEIKEKIETRNKLDTLVYSSEKVLNDNRDKISEGDAKNIEAALEKAKAAAKDGSIDEMNKASEDLTQASHKLAEIMYQTAQQAGAAGGGGPEQPAEDSQASSEQSSDADDNVIDAEFVESDDEKK